MEDGINDRLALVGTILPETVFEFLCTEETQTGA